MKHAEKKARTSIGSVMVAEQQQQQQQKEARTRRCTYHANHTSNTKGRNEGNGEDFLGTASRGQGSKKTSIV
jgi:hypothetical protein